MITDQILQQACEGDLSALKAIPKTDLHAHLLLSAPLQTYHELGHSGFQSPPQRFASLGAFLQFVRLNYIPIFKTIECYRKVARDCFAHMIEDGIVYTEISIDSRLTYLIGSSWRELLQMFGEEIARVEGKLKIRPELGLPRDFPHEAWKDVCDEALSSGFFKSIDLYGDETLKPASDFAYFFEEARRLGLKIKFHSGETSAPDRMASEIAFVTPHAIQHGIRSAEDPQLLKMLAAAQTSINVCPWSNIYLSVSESYAKHQIRKMFDHGLKVTINTDDFGVFGRSLSEEYAALYKEKIFTAAELEQIRKNGLSQIE